MDREKTGSDVVPVLGRNNKREAIVQAFLAENVMGIPCRIRLLLSVAPPKP